MSKTLRMIYPVWQGGVNPDYAFGAEGRHRKAERGDPGYRRKGTGTPR